MSSLTQDSEGHVGMYSAGLVVLQLLGGQSRDTNPRRLSYGNVWLVWSNALNMQEGPYDF